jgi:protein-tyrosine phosphatase
VGYAFVIPRLAQGSLPTGPIHRQFQTVVLGAEEAQNLPLFGLEVVRAPLEDAVPTDQQIEIAYMAAVHVVRRWRQGRSVLVTCFAGRNRSGLIVALALMMMGMNDRQAVQAIRTARGPMALSNKHFVRVLERAQSARAA